MTRVLFKDFLREIRKSMNRFLSILCIVAIGAAFFVGLKASAPDMSYTMDNYYDAHNVMDIQVMSTLGLTEEDIQTITELDGVEKVQAGYFTDALTYIDSREWVIRLHSLPANYQEGDYINQIKLVEGRLPENESEILVEKELNQNLSIDIGTVVSFETEKNTPITEDHMKLDTFTVVGKITTPYYLTYDKGTSQIGGKAISSFAYALSDAFDYGDIFTEALVTLKGARELNAFNADYRSLIADATNNLNNIGVDRAKARGESLKEGANEQLAAAQAEFDKQVAALEEARQKLIDAEKELAVGKEIYALEVKRAEEDIATGEEQLRQAQKSIADGKKELANGEKEYAKAKADYEAAIKENQNIIDAGKNVEATLSSSLASLEEQMESVRTQIKEKESDPEANASDIEQLNSSLSFYQTLYNSLNSVTSELGKKNESVDSMLSAAEKSFADAEKRLQEGKKELAQGEKEYREGVRQLEEGKKELADKKIETEKQFADAQKQIDDGWKEYTEGERQLEDAEDQLIEAKYQIERMDNAVWYVLGRDANYGFVSYQGTVDRMAAISSVLPLFFILVAVLVCLTTLNRMVTEQRGIIGTYKAFGYDNNQITAKYVWYVAIASLIGACIGAVAGTLLFPRAVYMAWSAMYSQPAFEQTIHYDIIILSLVISVVVMILTAYYTCRTELKATASQLMRPKAPKMGKTILLERISIVWKLLNFSQKVTARNIFRYKKRLFMTIIGIMGCSALILAGFGMNDTISMVVVNQFDHVLRYDVSVELKETITKSEREAINASVLERPEVLDTCTVGMTSLTMSNNHVQIAATAYVAEDEALLKNYIHLVKRGTDKELQMGEGIILTEKMAEQLGVKAGDVIDVTNASSITKKLEVTGITENYVFHYAYLNQDTYKNNFWNDIKQNTVLVKLTEGLSDDQVSELRTSLESEDMVSSLTVYTDVAKDFSEQIGALKSIIVIIIGCAALLAFVVLHNLTNVNISERVKEIATIKVLGFKGKEVSLYVYRENFLLTVMGAVLGLFLGVGLHRVIIKSIEQSYVMFGYQISPFSYVISVVLTCLFSIFVMLYMNKKLTDIPMVESLKAIE